MKVNAKTIEGRDYRPHEYWDARARSQGKWYVGDVNHNTRQRAEQERVFAAALDKYLPGRVEAVLDFGCGVGRLAPKLANGATQYYGVDICQSGLAMCPLIANATFLHLGVDIPLEPELFDCIVAVTVLQHISDREIQHWLREIGQVALSNAVVVIIDHNPETCPKPAAHMFPREPEFYIEALQLEHTKVELLTTDAGALHYVLTGEIAK